MQKKRPTSCPATGNVYNLVYGAADQKGQPVIEKYMANGGGADVFNDAVTGQPTMITTTTGTAAMYVYDGLGNPNYLLTNFSSQA